MHEMFMKEAIKLSTQKMRQGEGGPFGAVIVKDGEIIARGFNQVLGTNDPTAHAEMVAIRAASQAVKDYQLTGCVIYSSCEPCPMCLSAIYWARLEGLYYANTKSDAKEIGFDDFWLYEEVIRPVTERKIPTKQLLRDEAQAAFKEWEQKEDKLLY